MGTGGKVDRVWLWPPTPYAAPRLKKEQSYIYTPLWTFMACWKVNFIDKRVSAQTERASDFVEELD